MYSYDYRGSYDEDERYYYRYTLKLNPNKHVYVYWNGKVEVPVGQASIYLKSVTVF
jgi:hypothetical protein